MKFIEGQRLDQHVATVDSVPDRLRLILRVCEAVAFAHARGVLHRDLKPANIMVGPFGEVLVMDWGLAKILRGKDSNPSPSSDPENTVPTEAPPAARAADESTAISTITGHGTILGTPGYMSPEQARGDIEHLDSRSDIFSLGALLRFVLSEKSKQSSSTSERHLDKSLQAICAKACAENAANRYATVSDLAQDISRYLDGLAISAHRESLFDRATRFYRKYRFFILLMLAYLVMRVLLLMFMGR